MIAQRLEREEMRQKIVQSEKKNKFSNEMRTEKKIKKTKKKKCSFISHWNFSYTHFVKLERHLCLISKWHRFNVTFFHSL